MTKGLKLEEMTDENISAEIVKHLKETFEGYIPVPANIILGEYQSCVADQLFLNSEYRMRRNQLEFKLEEFRENEQNTYTGYIDANKPEEILHEILVEFHKIYGNNTDFNEFCNKAINFDGMRFGDTSIKLVNTRRYSQRSTW